MQLGVLEPEAQQVKRRLGLVGVWRRAGLGKVIHSCPIAGSTPPGSEGFLVCMCVSWGASAASCCAALMQNLGGGFFFGFFFSVAPRFCVAVDLLC